MEFYSTKEPLKNEEVMAQRIYFFGPEPGRRVSVRIAFPTWLEAEKRAVCKVEIDDGEDISVKPMNGDDAIEAIQLALALIGTELGLFLEWAEGSVSWLDGKRNDLGVPTYPDFALFPSRKIPSE